MSKLFNELSEKDVKLIDNFIQDKVGDHESVGHLLREWSAEKETLYKMFGNHFILNKKIEYNKPISNLTDELNDRFSNYDSACNQFRRTFDRFLWENRVQLGNDYDLLQGLHALLVVFTFMFGLFLFALHAFLVVLEVTGGRFLLTLLTLFRDV